jgi:hypothetical protein
MISLQFAMLDNNIFNGIDPDVNFIDNLYGPVDESSYYTIQRFNSKFSLNYRERFSLCNFNIRSFNANSEYFLSNLSTIDMEFSSIVLTETRFNEFNIRDVSGYAGHHTIRGAGCGGGVSVYCIDKLNCDKLCDLCYSDNTIESCVVRIKYNMRTIVIVAIYRPPSGNIDSFNIALLSILNHELIKDEEIILAGDFNINIIEYDNAIQPIRNFVYNMFSKGFLSVITEPTRRPIGDQHGSPSLLDHIWYNKLNLHNSGILLCDTTDHEPTFLILNDFSITEDKLVKVEFRDHSELNKCIFIQRCKEFSFDLESNDVNVSVQKFSDSLNKLYCKCFPIKVKYVSYKRFSKPWLTPHMLKSIKQKSLYYNMYKNGVFPSNQYNRYRNLVNNAVKKAKSLYYQNSFNNCKNNLKKTWKLINGLIHETKPNKSVSEINVGGNVVSDNNAIAEIFSDYFSNVATKLQSDIPDSNCDPMDYLACSNINSIYFSPVDVVEVENIILHLKNSSYGLNVIPTKIVKLISVIVSEIICNLINDSLSSGIFPQSLKRATIIPLFKSGDSSDINNYRPISTLPMLSKILEKCIYVRMSGFFDKFNIINSDQFGFQKGKSTAEAISNFVEYVYRELNLRKHVFSVFIDYRKAFDTVSHNILLKKLYRYGIRGIPLKLISSYLSNREQLVKIGNLKSQVRTVKCGVPQGSVLGPMLFLLYINDLPLISNSSKFTLFADDTTLSYSNIDYSVAVRNTNEQLTLLYNWTISNKLSLNASKTYAVLFTNRINDVCTPLLLNICDGPVLLNDHVKYLGMNIDYKLDFSQHIKLICSKISKSCGVLYRLSSFVPHKVLITLYYNLVYPYILYGILSWGSAADVHMHPLFLLQKKIIRIVTHANYLDNTTPLFYRTNILKLFDVYKLQLGIFMYNKSRNNSLLYPDHNYDTRGRHNVVPLFQRLSQCQRSVLYCGPKLWNSIPPNIKNSANANIFKKMYRSYLVQQYNQ